MSQAIQFLSSGVYGWGSARPPSADGVLDLQRMHGAARSCLSLDTSVGPSHGLGASVPLARDASGICGGLIGHPAWMSGELQRIAREEGNSRALLAAYREDPRDFLRRINGGFSFVVHDAREHRLLAGIDRTGQFSLYYQRVPGGVLFASSAGSLLAHPSARRAIDPQGIFNYLYFHMVPSPGSVFQDVHKLSAGHLLQWNGQEASTRAYWKPDFRGQPRTDKVAARAELKQTLREAVDRACAGVDHARCGAFLSGGLDSSSVVGMLAEVTGGAGEAFSIGFSAEGYDEIPFARTSARHFGVKLHEYYVTPEDVVDQLPLIATSYDEPFGNSSALPAWFCARLAKAEGSTRLLAGDGGDELFAGNERYAKQAVFERYRLLPAILRRALLEPLVQALPSAIPGAAKGRSFLRQANTPLPDRMQSYNHLQRIPLTEMFEADFLAQVDADGPISRLRALYAEPQAADPLSRMLRLDWQVTLADNDLRKVSHMCAGAGMEVTYPMLDDALIELSQRLPSKWKLRGSNLRAFYKESLTGWLPQQTIDKDKKGFGLPFGVWMQTHKGLHEMACDSLASFRHRHLLKGSFIDHLVRQHQTEHASYFGEFVWVLMVLEMWLQGASE